MDIVPEISERCSVRNFLSKKVEKGKIDRILTAGQLAPSAKNRQEWRFVVVQDDALRMKIQDAAFGQEHVGKAPVIIAVCPTNIDYRMPNGEFSYSIDISFAASFMLLQATREGLGSCVVTTFDEREMKELMSIPYLMKVVMLILIGYTDQRPEKTPRKSLKRISSFDHW